MAACHGLFGSLCEPVARRSCLFELEAHRLDGVEQAAARALRPVDERFENAECVESPQCDLQGPHRNGHGFELLAGFGDEFPGEVRHVLERDAQGVECRARADVEVRELLSEVDQRDLQTA